jgi:hypothetical protein
MPSCVQVAAVAVPGRLSWFQAPSMFTATRSATTVSPGPIFTTLAQPASTAASTRGARILRMFMVVQR